MKVMDPSLSILWCTGTHSPDGTISVDCAASSPGGEHAAIGTCTLDGETLTCPYSVNGSAYSFVGQRSSTARCSE
jgi:hypothetical protein